MKAPVSSRLLFVMGFLLVVAANIVVLFGAYANRSASADSRVMLTERELPVRHWGRRENSGLSLHLDWRVLRKDDDNTTYFGPWGTPDWFNTDKARELGFDVDRITRREKNHETYKQAVPREVYLVLEYDGETFQKALRRLETDLEKKKTRLAQLPTDKQKQLEVQYAENHLNQERIRGSRLFAVDAGLDPRALRNAYPDRSRFIITKATVMASPHYQDKNVQVYGNIKKISVDRIHVPLNHRIRLDGILKSKKTDHAGPAPPRYTVDLAYGSRYEPWLAALEPMGNPPAR